MGEVCFISTRQRTVSLPFHTRRRLPKAVSSGRSRRHYPTFGRHYPRSRRLSSRAVTLCGYNGRTVMSRKSLTPPQAIEAWRLVRAGTKLSDVAKALGLRCSRMSISRAVRSVTSAEERIEIAQRTGNWDCGLTVGETLIALRGAPAPAATPVLDESSDDSEAPDAERA
jgi:hypothetical protein